MKKKIELTEEQKATILAEKLLDYNTALTAEISAFELQKTKELKEINSKWDKKIENAKVSVKFAYYEDDENEKKVKREKTSREKWTDENKNDLVARYVMDQTIPQIAKTLNRTQSSVRGMIDKLKGDKSWNIAFGGYVSKKRGDNKEIEKKK